jgi:hypothetical protein
MKTPLYIVMTKAVYKSQATYTQKKKGQFLFLFFFFSFFFSFFIGNQRNFIKSVGASEHTGNIQNDTNTERVKKQEKNLQRPNHNRKPSKNQPQNPQQYYITAKPSCFCPE